MLSYINKNVKSRTFLADLFFKLGGEEAALPVETSAVAMASPEK
jgi:hypothetical protein